MSTHQLRAVEHLMSNIKTTKDICIIFDDDTDTAIPTRTLTPIQLAIRTSVMPMLLTIANLPPVTSSDRMTGLLVSLGAFYCQNRQYNEAILHYDQASKDH